MTLLSLVSLDKCMPCVRLGSCGIGRLFALRYGSCRFRHRYDIQSRPRIRQDECSHLSVNLFDRWIHLRDVR
jgi:hypothetical protein